MKALFVNVNQTFDPEVNTIDDLRNATVHAWRISRSKAEECDVVVMTVHGYIVGAFRLIAAIPNPDFAWDTTGRNKQSRTSLILGEAVPIRPAWHEAKPGLRNGVAVVNLPDPASALAVQDFDPEDLPQTGARQYRKGGDYKPHMKALSAFAMRDSSKMGHVKALTHLGWARPGEVNKTSPTPSTAFAIANASDLPPECWTVGEPAGPQISANLRALAEAGAPAEALDGLWSAYVGTEDRDFYDTLYDSIPSDIPGSEWESDGLSKGAGA